MKNDCAVHEFFVGVDANLGILSGASLVLVEPYTEVSVSIPLSTEQLELLRQVLHVEVV